MSVGTNKVIRSGGIGQIRVPAGPLVNDAVRLAQAAAKRAIDLCLAFFCLVVATPLMLVVALAIWLVDGGQVIYRHRRIGRHGAVFDCLKFRTMVRGADAALDAHLEGSPAARAAGEASRKLRDDPRVLGSLGRFLRQRSLDELPQIFNVIAGDMSLVGPRPVVEGELVCYGSNRRWYLAGRPGVTGPWQVGGRSDTSYAARVRLDVQYAKHPSLRRDLGILAQTARQVFSGRGAY